MIAEVNEPRTAVTELSVSGMTCRNCARHVTEALSSVSGVASAIVSLEEGSARVQWKPGAQPNPDPLIDALKSAGFEADAIQPAQSQPTELTVEGMTCRNCARHVSEALNGVPGVSSVTVSLEDSKASVQWGQNVQADRAALISALKDAGFEAKLTQPDESCAADRSRLSGWSLNLILGSICTIPLLVGEWGFGLAMERWFQWLAFALALPVQVFCGARFYRGAWNQLKVGSSSMDTLVALGSTTAFGYSVWALFAGHGEHVFFMEAAAIITLISLGHWMEERMSRHAESSLRALLHLTPQQARRRNPDGSESEIPVSQLRIKDLVVLRPGDRVPTDGDVIGGQSAIDESMLTGESLPGDKRTGDQVFAGTININGSLVFRVTATGESTALAHIISAVQRAQNSRADIQRLADRVSSVFVPIVVLIAIATGLLWAFAPDQARAASQFLSHYLWPATLGGTVLATAIMAAAAVLIVACPCAMGLATPIAIMAGANAAAKRGILIRDGIALERAGQITSVVFDKTGTLTLGKPAVAETVSFDNTHSSAEVLSLAAKLAEPSNHPLSRAIHAANPKALVLNLVNWQELRGSGTQAQWQRSGQPVATLRLGSLAWLNSCKIDSRCAAEFSQKWLDQGATVIGLACDGRLIGAIALRDTIKPGTKEVIHTLHRAHLKTWLITGDNPRAARAIASQVGIAPENVIAEVRPEQKADAVTAMQQRAEKVAFVGDGINDAPALEQADLGIAVSSASDVAHEAADLILLRSDIHAIPEAIDLARASLRVIKQNLFWAFFYNSAAIPLAALGLLSPVLCAAAMGLSDFILVANALRLARRKRFTQG